MVKQRLLTELGDQGELRVQLENAGDVQNFKMMLQYMYTGTLPSSAATCLEKSTNAVMSYAAGTADQRINENNAMPLVQLCHEYGIEPLKEECGDYLFVQSEHINVAYLLGTTTLVRALRQRLTVRYARQISLTSMR